MAADAKSPKESSHHIGGPSSATTPRVDVGTATASVTVSPARRPGTARRRAIDPPAPSVLAGPARRLCRATAEPRVRHRPTAVGVTDAHRGKPRIGRTHPELGAHDVADRRLGDGNDHTDLECPVRPMGAHPDRHGTEDEQDQRGQGEEDELLDTERRAGERRHERRADEEQSPLRRHRRSSLVGACQPVGSGTVRRDRISSMVADGVDPVSSAAGCATMRWANVGSATRFTSSGVT